MSSWRMAQGTPRTDRRTEALSKERIVEAAIGILDAAGEDGLTFRTLAARLATGSGAIYWHVADKNELLAAAADHVVARATGRAADGADPRGAIRALAPACSTRSTPIPGWARSCPATPGSTRCCASWRVSAGGWRRSASPSPPGSTPRRRC